MEVLDQNPLASPTVYSLIVFLLRTVERLQMTLEAILLKFCYSTADSCVKPSFHLNKVNRIRSTTQLILRAFPRDPAVDRILSIENPCLSCRFRCLEFYVISLNQCKDTNSANENLWGHRDATKTTNLTMRRSNRMFSFDTESLNRMNNTVIKTSKTQETLQQWEFSTHSNSLTFKI